LLLKEPSGHIRFSRRKKISFLSVIFVPTKFKIAKSFPKSQKRARIGKY
jgi:hypothetical protein